MEDNERLEVTPLDFLEAVYCNPNLPLATRLRAAIEAAPYKHPKLSATAIATMAARVLRKRWNERLNAQNPRRPY